MRSARASRPRIPLAHRGSRAPARRGAGIRGPAPSYEPRPAVEPTVAHNPRTHIQPPDEDSDDDVDVPSFMRR